VNQTTYYPIRDSPIAVSIETKQDYSSRDPVLQLGIWVAAWHRRMMSLYTAPAPMRAKVVSLPLIVTTGHDWQVYFACDRDNSIEMYGPLRMGSSATLLDAYVLLASLSSLKEWIETTFYQAMRDW
ncbi:hypothetical protein F5883DRAFT_356436, partial [Diaporthe sp. PMI_573]